MRDFSKCSTSDLNDFLQMDSCVGITENDRLEIIGELLSRIEKDDETEC